MKKAAVCSRDRHPNSRMIQSTSVDEGAAFVGTTSLREFDRSEQSNKELSGEMEAMSRANFPSALGWRGSSISTSLIFGKRLSSEVMDCSLPFRASSVGEHDRHRISASSVRSECSREGASEYTSVLDSSISSHDRYPTPPQRREERTPYSVSFDSEPSSCLFGREHETASPSVSPERHQLLLPGIRPRAGRGTRWSLDTNTTLHTYVFGSPPPSMLAEDGIPCGILSQEGNSCSFVESLATLDGRDLERRATDHPQNGVEKSAEEDESEASDECTEDEEGDTTMPGMGKLQDAQHNDKGVFRSGYKRKIPFSSCACSSVALRRASQRLTGRRGCFCGRSSSDECQFSSTPRPEGMLSSTGASSERERSNTGNVRRRRRRRLLGSPNDRRSVASTLPVADRTGERNRERAVKFSTTLCQVYVYEASPCTVARADRVTDEIADMRLGDEHAVNVSLQEAEADGGEEKHLSLSAFK